MNGAIVHRGPDDQGIYRSPDQSVSLAMRRLSILDLESGHQPMSDASGQIWIIFNGEIFNAPELRLQLERQGHQFRTKNSDTEVLLQLYLEKGPACLDDLNGMFAFVIHDRRKNVLFGARDRMGIKPLYYWHQGGRLACASELKALLQLPIISRDIDPQSLFHYMTLLYVPDQASIMQGVFRLPPGHRFVYDLEQSLMRIEQYWRVNDSPTENRSEDEWAELIRAELRAAVKRWTLSDVDIACSLSGGLDSSAIVGLLAELGCQKIKTYSLGFLGDQEHSWNETDLARQVAQRWGTDHHEYFLKPRELLQDLLTMVWHLDEPYGGGLPAWYVFREMSKDVKVALTGTGGDEVFGNYGKFCAYEEDLVLNAAHSFRGRHQAGADVLAKLSASAAELTEYMPASIPLIGKGRLFSKLPLLLSEGFGRHHYANFAYLSDEQKHQYVLQATNGDIQDTATYLQGVYDSSHATDLRNGLAAVDFRTQLAEEFLFMTDRFSMAHSLEARVPFLDHLFVEKMFRIPSSMRTRGTDPKYLLKRAVGDLLPPDLLTAPKRGFVIPIELWLRGELRPLVDHLLNPQRLKKQGLFQPQFYDHFVRPHLEGRSTFTWQVWAALMFQLW
ncbi:MAG: asparagine synthase (glutamine-hydrolyzing), partial [Nitrospirales bacterium]